jgi:single-strand DNA-binding protein
MQPTISISKLQKSQHRKEITMYQEITLVGKLGNDPEKRTTPGGKTVASFSLAVNKTWTKDGQRQEKTTWFRCTAWEKQAEIVSANLTKGRKVMVVGEVEDARAFTDRDGNNRASLEVTASRIVFLDSAPANQSTQGNPPEASADIPW